MPKNIENKLKGFTKNVNIALPVMEFWKYQDLLDKGIPGRKILTDGILKNEADLVEGLTQNNNA